MGYCERPYRLHVHMSGTLSNSVTYEPLRTSNEGTQKVQKEHASEKFGHVEAMHPLGINKNVRLIDLFDQPGTRASRQRFSVPS